MRWAGLWGAAVLFACGGSVSHGSGGSGATGGQPDGGPPPSGASPGEAGPYSGADCNGIVPSALGTVEVSSSGSCPAATKVLWHALLQ